MLEPKTYRIKDALDFQKVPADRREDCLHEFIVFLASFDLCASLGGKVFFPNYFEWIDDGLSNIKVTLSCGDEKILLLDAEMKRRGAQ